MTGATVTPAAATRGICGSAPVAPGASMSSGGFTLVELLVVLVLLGLLGTVVGARLPGTPATIRAESAVHKLEAALRQTRARALAEGRPQTLWLEMGAHRYGSPNRGWTRLPASLVWQTDAGDGDTDMVRFRFFPDGGAIGGRVRLTHHGRAWEIVVSPLTGAVRVDGDGR